MGLFKPNIEKLLKNGDLEGLEAAVLKSYNKGDYKTSILAIRALGTLGDQTAIYVVEEMINHSMSSEAQAEVGKEAMLAFGELGEMFYTKRMLYAMNRIQFGRYFETIKDGFVEGIGRIYWKGDQTKKSKLIDYLESLLNDPKNWIAPGMDFAFELLENSIYSTMDHRALPILEGRLESETNSQRKMTLQKQVDILREMGSQSQ